MESQRPNPEYPPSLAEALFVFVGLKAHELRVEGEEIAQYPSGQSREARLRNIQSRVRVLETDRVLADLWRVFEESEGDPSVLQDFAAGLLAKTEWDDRIDFLDESASGSLFESALENSVIEARYGLLAELRPLAQHYGVELPHAS